MGRGLSDISNKWSEFLTIVITASRKIIYRGKNVFRSNRDVPHRILILWNATRAQPCEFIEVPDDPPEENPLYDRPCVRVVSNHVRCRTVRWTADLLRIVFFVYFCLNYFWIFGFTASIFRYIIHLLSPVFLTSETMTKITKYG